MDCEGLQWTAPAIHTDLSNSFLMLVWPEGLSVWACVEIQLLSGHWSQFKRVSVIGFLLISEGISCLGRAYGHLYGFSLLSSLLSYPASQHGTAKRSFPDSSVPIDFTLHTVSQGISAHYEFPRFWYFLIIAPNEMIHIRA